MVEDEGVGPLLLEFDKYSHAKTADRRMLVVAQIRHEKAAKKKKKKCSTRLLLPLTAWLKVLFPLKLMKCVNTKTQH